MLFRYSHFLFIVRFSLYVRKQFIYVLEIGIGILELRRMFLSLSFIVLQVSLIATAFAFNETSEYAENFSYSIQKPYDKNLSERYSLSSGVHHFWVYDDDKPHSTTSNTEPRTEMRINNDYRSGIHTFDGDVDRKSVV